MAFRIRPILGLVAAAGLALAASAAPAVARVVYATDFSAADGFAAGPIGGQNGWSFISAGGPPQSASIVPGDGVVLAGPAAPFTGIYHADGASGLVDLYGLVGLTQGLPTDSWQFASMGPGLAQYIGGITVVGTNIYAISGAYPLIGSFSENTLHEVQVLMNFTSQTTTIILDGSVLASGLPFCGSSGVCTGAPVSTFGDGLFDTYGLASNYGVLGYYGVAEAGVPEPAGWALSIVGLAMAGGALRARRRAGPSRLAAAGR